MKVKNCEKWGFQESLFSWQKIVKFLPNIYITFLESLVPIEYNWAISNIQYSGWPGRLGISKSKVLEDSEYPSGG